MSTRGVPATLEDRVAQLEEWQRTLQRNDAVRPTDVRLLYSARGEILFAAGPREPEALPPPGDALHIDGGFFIGWNPTTQTPEWKWIGDT